MKVAKLEGQVLEGQQRLDMVEGKTKEAQALQHDIKSLRAEGVRRVFEVRDKLSNKQMSGGHPIFPLSREKLSCVVPKGKCPL